METTWHIYAIEFTKPLILRLSGLGIRYFTEIPQNRTNLS
jgi:hypothetical protein